MELWTTPLRSDFLTDRYQVCARECTFKIDALPQVYENKKWVNWLTILLRPKAQVSYCHSAPSVVCSSDRRRPSSGSSSSLNFQNRMMDFDETLSGWSTHGPLQVLLFFGYIRPGADQGRAKIGHGGPSLKKTSSSDRNTTATNRRHSNTLKAYGKKCCYFWFHSEDKFFTRYDNFFDLVILPYLNAISIDFYTVKCFICIF